MKWYGVSASLLILAAMLYAGQSLPPQAGSASRTPVLVELFTSEGCSSCPPADQVLAQLDAKQPVAGAEIVVMSEHVDYWNSLGWKDPFSAATFTDRQNAYSSSLGNSGIYTPQMIVDGKTEFIGNEISEAIGAIAGAARTPKAPIAVSVISSDNASAKIRVQLNSAPPIARGDSADVYVAVVENNLSSNVARGENKGQKLNHVAVVRLLNDLGHLPADRPYSTESVLKISASWKRPDLRIIAFVQTNKKRQVIALSKVPL
jgi:hypothetical protein